MKELLATLASIMGVCAFCKSIIYSVFPPDFRYALLRLLHRFYHFFSPYCFYDITEIDGVNTNELYNAVQLYLSSSAFITGGNRHSLTRGINSSVVVFGLSNNDSLIDNYNGISVLWEHVIKQQQSQSFSWRPLPNERRGFILRVKKKDKEIILGSYLDFVMEKAIQIRRNNQDRLLFTNSRGCALDSRNHPWESVPFKNPSTFQTLAMDPDKKSGIMSDLEDFANGESFYQKTGRAWKRGYLLYGPPGTGKSSMIAAMANYLKYDIYDLELTEVNSNSELRKLLMKTNSKSIIVIEDIDCSINLSNRKNSSNCTRTLNYHSYPYAYDVSPPPEIDDDDDDDDGGGTTITLSGLLNFTDGLWSCCGSERIFVFTTNHIDKLDPALVRSGRMDMHVYMSYCTFSSLKILLKNYLNYDDGDLEAEVAEELKAVVEKAKMTPADVSEVLIKNKRDKGKAVKELLDILQIKANQEKLDQKQENKEQYKAMLGLENYTANSIHVTPS